ncbi:hypothetical protein LCM10_09220 [Rossellomorea aquimaris]|uniref:M14 family zinc carboxypeptidase n=1 Tax=Rossellomorea aquimaris TaxID=189382 RepID=UPI001CD3F69A|nr:M14 family zinc carboxypeptidase [Rossellomorea aquimaris]MCA1055167.1 hypothetical protein [Rossellomorea aquimaris]
MRIKYQHVLVVLVLLITIVSNVNQAEAAEYVKFETSSDIEATSDNGSVINISKGSVFYGNYFKDDTYSVSINKNLFYLNAATVKVLKKSEEVEEVNESYTKVVLANGDTLVGTENGSTIQVLNQMEAEVNAEGKVIIGQQPYEISKEQNKELIVKSLKVNPESEPNTYQYSFEKERAFKVLVSNVSIYVKGSNDQLLPIGKLQENGKYRLIRDLGNWLEIKIGNQLGYVWKEATQAIDSTEVPISKNEENNLNQDFTSIQDITIYEENSLSSGKLAMLNKDTTLSFSNVKNSWGEIQISGRRGFLPLNSVNFVKRDTDYDYIQINDRNTSLYSNDGEGLIRVGKLELGEIFRKIRTVGNWYEVELAGKTAYVWKPAATLVDISSKNYISEEAVHTFKLIEDATAYDNSTGSLTAIAKLTKGQELKYIESSGNWYVVNVLGRKAYIYKSAVKIEFQSSHKYFQVNQPEVPIIINKDGKKIEIGYLKEGHVYKRTDDAGNWHVIEVMGHRAYVWKSATDPYVSNIAHPTYNQPTETFTAQTVLDLDIYDNSSGKLVSIARLNSGVNLQVLKKVGNWFEVIFAGRKMYIYQTALKPEFTQHNRYFEIDKEIVPIVVNENGRQKEIGYLEKGMVYKRDGDAGNWHVIHVMGRKAYVWEQATIPNVITKKNSYNVSGGNTFTLSQRATVYDNSTGTLKPIASLGENSKFNYINRVGNWYKVNFSNIEGFIYKDAVKLKFIPSDQYFEVIHDNTEIIMNVNGKQIEVGSLTKGQVYKRIGDAGNWHTIEFMGKHAYVWKESTSPYRSNTLPHFSSRKNIGYTVTSIDELSVYDNSYGKLMPIGKIGSNTTFRIEDKLGSWYEINFSGRKGFIYAPGTKKQVSLIVNPRQVYSYEQMEKDLYAIASMYPDNTELTTIGKSIDGRKLYALKLGKGNKEILIDGSTHAREHMTTNVVMSMLDNYAYAYHNNQLFEGKNVRKILNETSIWFVPMVNPDGVTLVQKGYKSAMNPSEVLRINNLSTDFSSWKANIRGVDINRQFPADWGNISNNAGRPSYKNYKGTAPFTEPEAIAMANFVNKHNFKASATYHSSGQIIYWFFNQTDNYGRDYKLASKIGDITGYSLVRAVYQPSAAFQDWFIKQTGYPSFTIEISPYILEGQVPLNYYDKIWKENKKIGLVIAEESKYY